MAVANPTRPSTVGLRPVPTEEGAWLASLPGVVVESNRQINVAGATAMYFSHVSQFTVSDSWPELDDLLSTPFVMLTTFRRSGAGVDTAVWLARVDGQCLFTTPESTGKVKRLATSSKVRLGRSDLRGRARPGPAIEANAQRIDNPELLAGFVKIMRRKNPVMSRVIELMYRVKRDQRLLYLVTRP